MVRQLHIEGMYILSERNKSISSKIYNGTIFVAFIDGLDLIFLRN